MLLRTEGRRLNREANCSNSSGTKSFCPANYSDYIWSRVSSCSYLGHALFRTVREAHPLFLIFFMMITINSLRMNGWLCLHYYYSLSVLCPNSIDFMDRWRWSLIFLFSYPLKYWISKGLQVKFEILDNGW